MRFHATLQLNGKTATGIDVPADVVEALGASKRPPVIVTINGHSYRSTIASRGGQFKLPVSAERRERIGIEAGDQVDVELKLDTAPRVVEVPGDLAQALGADSDARRTFDSLTASQQGAFVAPIEAAKKPETRERRIKATIERLRAGQKR